MGPKGLITILASFSMCVGCFRSTTRNHIQRDFLNDLHEHIHDKQPLPKDPFLIIWNTPSEGCKGFGVNLNLTAFDVVVNKDQKFTGDFVTIFYTPQLGTYPYVDKDGIHNGGIPQHVNLTSHLNKVKSDIKRAIPDQNFQGVGVIDWENWRPTWERNYDSKIIYQNLSEADVFQRHPSWNHTQIQIYAKSEFEQAARDMMEQTVRVSNDTRPGGYWGYYEFPECYNYAGSPECSTKTKQQNDKLNWLFSASTALFPSVYLHSKLKTKTLKQNFVHGQVQEAQRVAKGTKQGDKPVFVYARYRFANDQSFYKKDDLEASIGEIFNMGANCVILWGSSENVKTASKCKELEVYLNSTLGPYVKSINSFASKCSQLNCNGKGRCVLQNTSPRGTEYHVHGTNHLWNMEHYDCKCYPGWSGPQCKVH
ncbi:unnamed protein product [Owenia fusiformis]|uniref:Hyaluronidase n=1 Tax=Owenia fusiformis TaxID=6347 RepID=A0A8S4PSZ6_OWEFU|nr:unnamed protein product [Owenia fusiformis]